MTASTDRCDVAVIGAGTAGLSAQSAAYAAGAEVRLIDPFFAGTTCADVGCMPSKLLIAAADAAHGARHAEVFGVHAAPRIDGAAVMRRLREHRDRFTQGVKDNIARLPDHVRIKARARFAGPNLLDLGEGRMLEARAVVLAIGSRPVLPGPFAKLGPALLTNESIFEMEDLPASVGVIGAGALGLEMAQALARLGVEVQVFDRGARMAGLQSAELSDRLHKAMSREMPIHLGQSPEPEPVDGGVRLRWDGGEAVFERILVAAGRAPEWEGLELAKAGIPLDEDGKPKVDADTLQCGDSAVFVAGDANGIRPLLHEASAEGTIAGHNAAKHPEVQPARRKVPLVIAFTRPEACSIGQIPGDDEEDCICGEVDFADQGRAKVEARNDGLLRLHGRHGDGKLLGAEMCAPGGEHLAHLLALAIDQGLTAEEMLRMPFYHPVLEEGLKTALERLCAASSRPRPWHRPEEDPPGG